ncbi:unnamed protein product [Malus baccata var. baccata]
MTYFNKLHYKFYCPIVNVDKLWSLLSQEAKDNALLIDVTPYDFFKVMGKGMLPQHQPIVEIAIVLSYFQEIELEIERTKEGQDVPESVPNGAMQVGEKVAISLDS